MIRANSNFIQSTPVPSRTDDSESGITNKAAIEEKSMRFNCRKHGVVRMNPLSSFPISHDGHPQHLVQDENKFRRDQEQDLSRCN